MHKWSGIFRLFSDSGKELRKNRPLVLASSTAFFTIFSIPPIIIITVNALSLYFKSESITQSFSNKIEDIFGPDAGEQMASIAENFSNMASQPWITVAGSIFLVFVATNLFNVIKLSINQIWNIQLSSSVNFFLHLKKRLIALGIILLTGILFILSTLSDSLIAFVEDALPHDFGQIDTLLVLVLSKIISVVFITLWFSAVFRFLPDARVHWRAVVTGAFVTSILFAIGKYLLERFLIKSNIDSIFEASTSVVLIMLFIFYASIIMYYGASFTQAYANHIDKSMKLRKNARRVKVTTIKDDQ